MSQKRMELSFPSSLPSLMCRAWRFPVSMTLLSEISFLEVQSSYKYLRLLTVRMGSF
jgi:hypothetical protein